ncbi:dna-directed rna polymerase iii subunit rpc7 [Pyrenophora tritici-repentis]|uniref:DNA-directed RNA polymerase III subunit n=1 Tax=Pyrenophora tritici-repentis TaxID=45151 RepID=A0A5M9KUU6_9PLEO|nr:dna-directed rna polymerase iii subunit rpc7 [Pyrenophora tritici-repentis]KAF7566509.1 RNA-pol-3-Rpc31 domain containing protein [Pyrenophora tritici-repentis]
MPPARGGRGGRGGGRGGAFNPVRGTVTIAGTELNWDLSGLEIQKGPAERFPDRPPPQAPPPTDDEADMVRHHLSFRDRVHEGPFYTLLNDGMKDGLKRKASEPAPTEATLFDPFTGNQTYSAKYLKVRRRLPKLDERPYVVDLFPAELRSLLDGTHTDGNPTKKRRTLGGTQPEAVGEDDNYSAASTDSEESDDDYNAEQYFDNGEDDDIDDGDPYQNTYDE